MTETPLERIAVAIEAQTAALDRNSAALDRATAATLENVQYDGPQPDLPRHGPENVAFRRFMRLAWPWVLPDSPEWRNLRAAFEAGQAASNDVAGAT